ncbi:hypothetical protein D3C71_1508050 [compost metagenome]
MINPLLLHPVGLVVQNALAKLRQGYLTTQKSRTLLHPGGPSGLFSRFRSAYDQKGMRFLRQSRQHMPVLQISHSQNAQPVCYLPEQIKRRTVSLPEYMQGRKLGDAKAIVHRWKPGQMGFECIIGK